MTRIRNMCVYHYITSIHLKWAASRHHWHFCLHGRWGVGWKLYFHSASSLETRVTMSRRCSQFHVGRTSFLLTPSSPWDYLPLNACCFAFRARRTVFKSISANWKKNPLSLCWNSIHLSFPQAYLLVCFFLNALPYTHVPHSSPIFSMTRFSEGWGFCIWLTAFSLKQVSIYQNLTLPW